VQVNEVLNLYGKFKVFVGKMVWESDEEDEEESLRYSISQRYGISTL
jgi:hypothetical protein